MIIGSQKVKVTNATQVSTIHLIPAAERIQVALPSERPFHHFSVPSYTAVTWLTGVEVVVATKKPIWLTTVIKKYEKLGHQVSTQTKNIHP